MPNLNAVLETALYFDDLDRAQAFYEGVLGLSQTYADDRLIGYAIGKSVLLLFKRGASSETMHLPGGTIPPHDGSGPLHMAFAISADELPRWEEHLRNSDSRDRRPHRLAARREKHRTSATSKVTCWSSRRPDCGPINGITIPGLHCRVSSSRISPAKRRNR